MAVLALAVGGVAAMGTNAMRCACASAQGGLRPSPVLTFAWWPDPRSHARVVVSLLVVGRYARLTTRQRSACGRRLRHRLGRTKTPTRRDDCDYDCDYI